ncbi:MAG: hypothetical protein KatS3mg052_1974 [Candidatus Roseilinea sp.]|nr:MAG: hypothetical protein KatS3mg052_1974 [Candidatus Roseilinea sp.]
MNRFIKVCVAGIAAFALALIALQPAFAKHNNGNFKFYGTVQSLPAGLYGAWVVDGRTVNVGPGTAIKQKYGPIGVGSYVEVKGWLQPDGSVNATKIDVKRGNGGGPGYYTKFYGVVQSLPAGLYGAWVVNGRTVNVGPGTVIRQKYGPIGVGSIVEVKGYQQPDGSVNATKIEGKR